MWVALLSGGQSWSCWAPGLGPRWCHPLGTARVLFVSLSSPLHFLLLHPRLPRGPRTAVSRAGKIQSSKRLCGRSRMALSVVLSVPGVGLRSSRGHRETVQEAGSGGSWGATRQSVSFTTTNESMSLAESGESCEAGVEGMAEVQVGPQTGTVCGAGAFGPVGVVTAKLCTIGRRG